MAENSSFCTVDVLDCSVSLRRIKFGQDSYIPSPGGGYMSGGPEQTKWQTVPPLLELTSEAIVVNNWIPLIQLLLDQISSGPIYSTLLARALFHSKEEIVKVIFTKWPWQKMIFLDCPLTRSGISINLQPMMLMIIQVFTSSAMRGDHGVLRSLDISFCRLGLEIIKRMKKLMGYIQVSERLRDPYLHLPGDKNTFILYVHEDLIQKRIVQLFPTDASVVQSHLKSQDYEIVIIPTSGTRCISKYQKGEFDLERFKNVNTLKKVQLNMRVMHSLGFNASNQLKIFKETLLNLQNICIIYFMNSRHTCLHDTDDCFNELVSMQKGLKYLCIDLYKETLLPEHFTKLALSNHVSTLEEIGITYDNLDIVQRELFEFVERCSETLQCLHLQSDKLSGSFLRRLFTVLKTCKKLVVLVIDAVCEIDLCTREEAVNLGGLPEFAMFGVSVESADVANVLQLDHSMNEYRRRQLSPGFRRSIHVEYCQL